MIARLEIYDASTGHDVHVGTLYPSLRRGTLSTSFAYDPVFLARPDAYAIDPQLPLSTSTVHFSGLPGALRDSLPDRWGRHLIEREMVLASGGEGALRTLDDIDFLIGVFDLTREGSLRVKMDDGPFLSDSADIPPRIELPKLMAAARAAADDAAGLQQIKELMAAGSGSLGGARPKASVQEGPKLLLAKFSHPGDNWDVMGWEKTALDLGEKAGISVPKSHLVRIGNNSALLLERFDREKSLLEGKRIPYMSGMTLLSSEDGTPRDYAEIAEGIIDLCDSPKKQLDQLYRRVLFYVAVGNTDDHLRNWGFLRNGSWGLSPMFDVNPNPDASASRVTSIVGEAGRDASYALNELALFCLLDDAAVDRIVGAVIEAVSNWESVARRNGVKDSEINQFRTVFSSGIDTLTALH